MVNTIPEPGTTIAGVENETDVSVFCEVTDGGMQEVTRWSILTQNDENQNPNSVNDVQPEYSITGELVSPSGTSNLTFGTNLTILTLTPDFDRAVLFCGNSSNREAANFTLRIYREFFVCVHVLKRCGKSICINVAQLMYLTRANKYM